MNTLHQIRKSPCTQRIHALFIDPAEDLRALTRDRSGLIPPEVPPATTSTAATKGSSHVPAPEIFRLEDAEATVETLLLMEFADLGTLDQTVTSGRLQGNMVSASAGQIFHCSSAELDGEGLLLLAVQVCCAT